MSEPICQSQQFRDAEFKDASPLNTVALIKDILRRHNIQTEEIWMESGVPYCYSIRINVCGTNFGTNGKGLSREFALASGYGELMERLQLGYIGNRMVQKDGSFKIKSNYKKKLPASQLLEENQQWYAAFSDKLYNYTGAHMPTDALLSQFEDSQGLVDVMPYYNVTGRKVDYLPTALQMRVYSANGCAAGNTMEEAIVQGISEIVERNHQLRIIDEQITLPQIPEQVLQKYPVAYDIITYVRSKGYRVALLDASLGTKFPVVCACFVNLQTGKYHTHFGACPVFEIALERALTESFQGRNLDNLSKFDSFTYHTSERYSFARLTEELTKGAAEKSTVFFVGEPTVPFNEHVGFAGKNNKELLTECIAYFRDLGHDVLIKDYSCMGFPTYQTIVPGYSEVYIYCLARKLDLQYYLPYAIKTLRNPSAAGIEDMVGLLKHMSRISGYGANISNLHGFVVNTKLELSLDPVEDNYMMAASVGYVYYTLGRYQEAADCVNTMATAKGKDPYLTCLKQYLQMLLHSYKPEKIRQVLEYFHAPQTVEQLYSILDRDGNPLEKYTLHCEKNCTEECILYSKCTQYHTDRLIDLVADQMDTLDFEAHCQAMCKL